VKAWPAIGALVEHTGTLFIERGNRAAAARSAQAMAERLRAGERVAVFPEGTSTAGTHMLPFRAALFEAAIEAAAPVQALALRYVDEASGHTSLAPAYHSEISFGQSMLSIVRGPSFCARLQMLEPLSAAADRRALALQSESAIASALGFLLPTAQAAVQSKTPETSPGVLLGSEQESAICWPAAPKP
jgi:1-acyl-sn-glycerol-3-phosphate acyltransferase